MSYPATCGIHVFDDPAKAEGPCPTCAALLERLRTEPSKSRYADYDYNPNRVPRVKREATPKQKAFMGGVAAEARARAKKREGKE